MILLEKVKSIVNTYESLERKLASGDIDKKVFAKKSKEYSSIKEVIDEAKGYISFEKEKKDLEKIINEKNGDVASPCARNPGVPRRLDFLCACAWVDRPPGFPDLK